MGSTLLDSVVTRVRSLCVCFLACGGIAVVKYCFIIAKFTMDDLFYSLKNGYKCQFLSSRV